jgi:hypothetical protein
MGTVLLSFFRWTRFLLIWLAKTATDFESLVPRRKGMDFYRASNSPSWGAAVEGAVCRGCSRMCDITATSCIVNDTMHLIPVMSIDHRDVTFTTTTSSRMHSDVLTYQRHLLDSQCPSFLRAHTLPIWNRGRSPMTATFMSFTSDILPQTT